MNSLSSMPVLLNSLGSLSSPRCHVQQLMSMGRHINAALCALGGFKEMVKPGCQVTVRYEPHHGKTCKNKGADQLRSNCAADQHLYFCYIDSTMLLLPNKISSM